MTPPKIKATNWKDAMKELSDNGWRGRKNRTEYLKQMGFKKEAYKPDMTSKRLKYRRKGGKLLIRK